MLKQDLKYINENVNYAKIIFYMQHTFDNYYLLKLWYVGSTYIMLG